MSKPLSRKRRKTETPKRKTKKRPVGRKRRKAPKRSTGQLKRRKPRKQPPRKQPRKPRRQPPRKKPSPRKRKPTKKKPKRQPKRYKLPKKRIAYNDVIEAAQEAGLHPEDVGESGSMLFEEIAERFGLTESYVYSDLKGSPPDEIGYAA